MAGDNIFDEGIEEGAPEAAETPATTVASPAAPTEAAPSTGGDEAGSDDELFSFLDNTAGEDEAEIEEPQEAVQAAQPSAPPVPAPSPLDKVAEQMAAFLERQNTAPAAPQAPAAPVWVSPFERPENTALLDDLEERAVFDVGAAKELRQLERRLMREESDHALQEAVQRSQASVLNISSLQQQRDSAYNTLKASAPYVDRGSFDTAESEFIQAVFGGDTSAYAAMATNPQIRQQIANNAELAAIKARAKGKAAPTAKPTTAARPAASTSVSRGTPAPASPSGRSYSQIETRLADDSDYESEISSRAFGIGKKRNN